MDKFQWVAVLEILIAMGFFAIMWAFLCGPCHRMAYRLHGHAPHGGKYRRDEEPNEENENR